MSVLATPIRGLRMMTFAVVLMMARFALDLVLALWSLGVDSLDDLAALLTWSARVRLLDLAALTLLSVGVISNLGELRRRRLSVTTGVVALVTFVITFAVYAWMYDLMIDVAAGLRGEGRLLDHVEEVERVPMRMFLATVAYIGGLFATVRMVRGYAMTDGNLGLREQARSIAGLLILLLTADTFFRFTYGLGGGAASFGVLSIAAAIGLDLFWFWCHRRAGHLFDTAKYYLRATEDLPIAEARPSAAAVVSAPRRAASTSVPPPSAPPPRVAPSAPSAPRVAPIAPLPASPPVAPAPRLDDGPPPPDGGPRFLR